MRGTRQPDGWRCEDGGGLLDARSLDIVPGGWRHAHRRHPRPIRSRRWLPDGFVGAYAVRPLPPATGTHVSPILARRADTHLAPAPFFPLTGEGAYIR